MALTQEQVDWWFSQNPEATADDVAAAVKAAGGLEANQGLASMIANRYQIAEPEVTNYYKAYTAPKDIPSFTDTITSGAPTTEAELLNIVGGTNNTASNVTQTTDPFDAITAAWNTGDYAATNNIIANSGLTAADIKKHYNLDDATMNWVLGQGIKTADQAVATTGATTVTGATGNDTTTKSIDTVTGAVGNDTTTAATDYTAANWPTIIYGSTDEDGRPVTTTTTSDGTPFYLHDANEGVYYQNPNTVESYAPFTGADGQTYYAVYAPVFSSGKAWNETPVTGILTEAQYRALRGGSSAIGNLINSPVGSFGLGLLGPWGQVINAANQLNNGNLTGALLSGVNAAGGFGVTNIGGFDIKTLQNTAAGINAIDKKNLAGALTAGANLFGGTSGDYKTAASLASGALALKNNDTAGFLNSVGDLTGSADAKVAAAAVRLKAILESNNPNPGQLQSALANLTASVSGTGGSTASTGSTTVGNFEDNEVTRLKGLGYTNQQIQDYFNTLDNLTGALDTASTTGTDLSGLPTTLQLASAGDGVFRTDVGGTPIYAESKNAGSVTAPFGYSLLSATEADNKPAGSYYDPTTNAWFKPDTGVTDLTGSSTITSDADLFNSTIGSLDKLDTARTGDDFADFLASIGITNTTQLADSGLSNQDILDLINASDNTVTVTDQKGTDTITGVTGVDTITGATGNDAIDTVTVTGAKGNDTVTGIDTITGADGNDLIVDDKGEVIIKDKKEFCPIGTVLNPETGECDAVAEQLTCPPGKVPNEAGTACIDEVVIKDKKDFCPVGTVLNPETGECDPVDDKKTLDCPEGYEPNEAGTACIPVVEIKDKKCGPGFVYDEDLKQCVAIEEKPLDCPEGYEPNEAGTACIPVVEIKDKKCAPGFVYDEDLKLCVPIKDEPCAKGFHLENGICVPDDDDTCETGYEKVNGACVPVCADGYVRNMETGVCEKAEEPCPTGYERDEITGKCIPVIEIKDKKCDPGFVYDEGLKQCVPIKDEPCAKGFHLENGICVPDDDDKCEAGYEKVNGACVPVCAEGYVRNLETGVCEKTLDCPEGYEPNEAGTACIPVIEIKDKKCDPGFVYDEGLKQCVPIPDEPCAEGFHLENGICVADDDEQCKDGYEKVNGVCVPVCAEGYIRNLETGVCEKVEDKGCPPGQAKNAQGVCVPIVKPPPPPIVCPTGFKLVNGACVPITTVTPTYTPGAIGVSGEKIDPIYAGGMDHFDLLATLQEILKDEEPNKKDSKKSKEKTKMATGGHLDDLLAEHMTVDDLLKLLR